jgi:hypothetical protein
MTDKWCIYKYITDIADIGEREREREREHRFLGLEAVLIISLGQ